MKLLPRSSEQSSRASASFFSLSSSPERVIGSSKSPLLQMALSRHWHRPRINNPTMLSRRAAYSLRSLSRSLSPLFLPPHSPRFILRSYTLFHLDSALFVAGRSNLAELFVRHDSIRAFLSYLISDLTSLPRRGTRVRRARKGHDEG